MGKIAININIVMWSLIVGGYSYNHFNSISVPLKAPNHIIFSFFWWSYDMELKVKQIQYE